MKHPFRFTHPMLDRRSFLSQSGTALGSMALAHLLDQDGLMAKNTEANATSAIPIRPDIDPANPNAARQSHFPSRAKQVLMIFCSGAVSQLDTFDYKPELWRRHGQPMPGGKDLITFQGEQGNLTKSPFEFKPRGQSGKWTSDLVPHLGNLVDDFCFIHSLTFWFG